MSDLHTYSAGGMAQRLLEMLTDGPVAFWQFRDTCETAGTRRKAWYIVSAMRADGLIRRAGSETYDLTKSGREALQDMRAGQDVVIGEAPVSVRIFANPQIESAA